MSERAVEIQFRDFYTDDIRALLLEDGERVLNVESATQFDPIVRVWIEVPASLARQREETPDV